MSSPPTNPNDQFIHMFAILCVIAMLGHLGDQDYRDAMEAEYIFWLARISELIVTVLMPSL